MKKGFFITLEGPDGSGKTTVALKLKKALEDEGYHIVHTREPGGIEIAEQIRSVILDPKNTAMDARTEALLYAASRRQHLVEKVFPALERGDIVLCERFLDSSLAYQGYGRQIGFDEVYSINEFAIDDCFPDLTLFLDVDEAIGLSRIKDRSFKDRLDQESIDFHHRVMNGYREVLKRFPERITVIDAGQNAEKVTEDCLRIIEKKIDDRKRTLDEGSHCL